ncbi:conserved hypothetical protein [Trichinella spiralis]|uniref:hypothetical protein n=1 Tax=Trichinella spiralis TaxID=6334 RepID=UPI0001EFBADA|nr:conserved hypothetical protein [Trichinella spiralis]
MTTYRQTIKTNNLTFNRNNEKFFLIFRDVQATVLWAQRRRSGSRINTDRQMEFVINNLNTDGAFWPRLMKNSTRTLMVMRTKTLTTANMRPVSTLYQEHIFDAVIIFLRIKEINATTT